MSTTNMAMELLEVGQINKDTTINTALTKVDTLAAIALADAASDPATTGKAPGTTYYNTSSKVVKILTKSGVWSVVNGYLGEFASDPATTNLQAGSTYFNTGSSKLKVLKSDITWANVA